MKKESLQGTLVILYEGENSEQVWICQKVGSGKGIKNFVLAVAQTFNLSTWKAELPDLWVWTQS